MRSAENALHYPGNSLLKATVVRMPHANKCYCLCWLYATDIPLQRLQWDKKHCGLANTMRGSPGNTRTFCKPAHLFLEKGVQLVQAVH